MTPSEVALMFGALFSIGGDLEALRGRRWWPMLYWVISALFLVKCFVLNIKGL